MNGPLKAANGTEMYFMGEVRLEEQLGPRRFAVDFVVTLGWNFLSWERNACRTWESCGTTA